MHRSLRLCWVLMLALGSIASAADSARPNILFILTDDLGINDLACYGRKEHRTPHLDQLAREGVRFTSAYCAQPICSPSRAAIMTGKSPARLHLTTFLPGRSDTPSQKVLHPKMNQRLPAEETTIAETLRAAGYATACVGKWHLGGKGSLPTDHGFDVYHPGRADTKPSATEGGKGEYDLTRAAISFIETNRTRPFFLFLSHNTPHIPYTARPETVAKNLDTFEPLYAALIETMDDAVGMLLQRLDDLGLRTNTIVIFTSDNGGLHVPELKHGIITDNSPYRAGKGYLYEGGLRIPLIVRWPAQLPAGRVEHTPVINTSWFVTFCDAAGIPAPGGLEAGSILDVLKGRGARETTHYWHFPHYTNQGGRPGGAVREGNWKFIEFYDTGATELYDLSVDVAESNNVAGREIERARALQRKLHAWVQSVNAQTNTPNPDAQTALWKALYEDTDPSRYVPTRATAAARTNILEWRRQMDAVVPRPPAQR